MQGEALVGKIKKIEVKIIDENDQVMIYTVGQDGHHPHLRIGYNMEYDHAYGPGEAVLSSYMTSKKIAFIIDY